MAPLWPITVLFSLPIPLRLAHCLVPFLEETFRFLIFSLSFELGLSKWLGCFHFKFLSKAKFDLNLFMDTKTSEKRGGEHQAHLSKHSSSSSKKPRPLSDPRHRRFSNEGEEEPAQDERLQYLLSLGKVKWHDPASNYFFFTLREIPECLIFYRPGQEKSPSVQMSKMELEHIPLLEGEHYLQSLFLDGNRIKFIENLVSLPHLLELDLSGNQISIVHNLNHVKNLQTLNLSNNRIQKIDSLSSLSRLTSINLSRNQLTRLEGLQDLKSLACLHAKENRIDELPAFRLPSLVSVHLQKNSVLSFRPICFEIWSVCMVWR